MELILEKLLEIFRKISLVPRCSKKEQQICQWLSEWAESNNLKYKTDAAGNINIFVPGTAGFESSASVAIQGHMDMVCEKLSHSVHDFSKDGISVIREGDWLRADGTTLGADNGVAIILALALVEEKIPHPPLELLFTTDEESGLTGASSLQPDFIKSKKLINLDSEGEGVFTIGCAGGKDVHLSLPLEFEPSPANLNFLEIEVKGLRGGHSGVDINKNLASANKLLPRLLYNLVNKYSFNLITLEGGSAHNALARYASATICCYPEDREEIKDNLWAMLRIIRKEYEISDPEINLAINETGKAEQMISDDSTVQVLQFLLALPHGVSSMNPAIPGLVETSDNLAKMSITDETLKVLISVRSSLQSRLDSLTKTIISVADLAGADIFSSDGYPAWEADLNSELLEISLKVYYELFSKKALIMAIHAGLECGVIGRIYPEMQMISLGPTILNAHSPAETLNLPSLLRVWEFLVKLLSELK